MCFYFKWLWFVTFTNVATAVFSSLCLYSWRCSTALCAALVNVFHLKKDQIRLNCSSVDKRETAFGHFSSQTVTMRKPDSNFWCMGQHLTCGAQCSARQYGYVYGSTVMQPWALSPHIKSDWFSHFKYYEVGPQTCTSDLLEDSIGNTMHYQLNTTFMLFKNANMDEIQWNSKGSTWTLGLQLMLKENKNRRASAVPLFCPVLSALLYKQNIVGDMVGKGEVPLLPHDSWRTERVHLIS